MNHSTYRFSLDIHRTQSQVSIPVTLGDTLRAWGISLTNGGTPLTIEDGCLAMVSIKRPTGTYLETFCTIEENTTIKYDFEEKTAIVEGVHDCQVTLYDAEGEKIASPRFSMVVSDRVVNSDDINISDEDKTAIDAMIVAEASRQEAEIGRVNAEAARVAAEADRVNTENARVSAENARAKADAESKAAVEDAISRVDAQLAGVDLSKYYTKKETDTRISEAITTTLNTEV